MKKSILIFLVLFTSAIFSQEIISNSVAVSPNPFTENTNIHFKSNAKTTIVFSVRNLLGAIVYSQVVSTKIGENSIKFNKNNLSPGMYIYSIQNAKNRISKRFVIK